MSEPRNRDEDARDLRSEGSADAPLDELTGRRLGDFKVLRWIGRGAMADVYLADQTSLDRPVALKVLRENLAQDDSHVERFRREARAAASLVHANIVQIYEVGYVEPYNYIAQEYIRGCNLKQWLERHGPLSPRQAVLFLWQTASALARAADQGIVHRDIKPENIMLATSGEVKVADFGLARLLDPTGARTLDLTQIGMTVGTPLYMSPEQVEGRPLDPRSDIYSLGVTSFHVLTGQPPFQGENALNVAVQHLQTAPPPITSLREDLPEELVVVIEKMLAKDPADRLQSAQEILDALRPLRREYAEQEDTEDEATWSADMLLAAGEGSSSATERLGTLMRTQSIEARRRGLRWLPWSAVAVALLLGVLLAWRQIHRAEPSLLAVPSAARQSVPEFDTAAMQWLYAAQENTERAWLKVIERFPQNKSWVDRSYQKLALLYIANRDYEAAERILQEFAARDEAEREFQAFGLAGLCWIRVEQKQYDRAAELADQIKFDVQELRDQRMQQLLYLALQRIGRHTERQMPELIDQLERETASSDSL